MGMILLKKLQQTNLDQRNNTWIRFLRFYNGIPSERKLLFGL